MEKNEPAPANLRKQGGQSDPFTIVAVLSLVVAYLLWNRSVQAVGGTRTAIYMCITPLVAVGAAWVVLGEHARPLQAIGAVLIIAGVLLTRG